MKDALRTAGELAGAFAGCLLFVASVGWAAHIGWNLVG